jgi:hypothetical protein
MFRLVVAFPSSVCEIALPTPEAASSASGLMLLATMMLWMMLRCTAKDEVLYLPLGVEVVLRRRWIVAFGEVKRVREGGRPK